MATEITDWLDFARGDGPESGEQASLRVEIPLDLAQKLLERGHICAADLRCLDNGTKKRLQRLCLEACARCLGAGPCGHGCDQESCQRSGCPSAEGAL